MLLRVDGGRVQDMWSALSGGFEKECILLAFIVRMYHDAWTSECQIVQHCEQFFII
jgi:hypothetical protein